MQPNLRIVRRDRESSRDVVERFLIDVHAPKDLGVLSMKRIEYTEAAAADRSVLRRGFARLARKELETGFAAGPPA